MQHTTSPIVPSGGVQSPLLLAGQIQPGVFLTGEAAINLWQVDGLEGEDRLRMVKVPRPVMEAGHVHMFAPVPSSRVQAVECPCGMRVQPINSFLPSRGGSPPKAYVVAPPDGSEMQVPDEYAIYGYLHATSGALQSVVMKPNHQWAAAMPIIPALHELWRVPEELLALVAGEVEMEMENEADAPATLTGATGAPRWATLTTGATFHWITTDGTTPGTTTMDPTPVALADDDDDDDEDEDEDEDGAEEG